MEGEVEKKVCLKCLESKPLNHFYFTKSGNRIGECASCKTAYHRAYRERNKDVLNERKVEKRLIKSTRERTGNKKEKFKPGKCSKRSCHEPKVEFEGIIKFCKSHAYDYIFSIEDV